MSQAAGAISQEWPAGVQEIIKYLRDCVFFFFFYTVLLMAIPLSPCVSVSFYVLFSPSPLCLLYPPPPPQFAVKLSFPLLLRLPLAVPPSLMGNNIYQSAAEPCSTSCHGNQPHHSIYCVCVSSPPPSFLLSSISLSLDPLRSISPSLRGASLNCKWARWPLFR